MTNSIRERRTVWLLFLGVFGCYLAMSPGTISGQGYTGEEIASGVRILRIVKEWAQGGPLSPMEWSRHGPVPVLFDSSDSFR